MLTTCYDMAMQAMGVIPMWTMSDAKPMRIVFNS